MYLSSPTRSRAFQLGILAFLLGGFLFPFSSSVAAQANEEQAEPVAIFNSAQDLHEKGDLAGAIDLYKKALKVEPNFPEAEYQCGVAQLTLGQNAEAEKSFRKAVALRPEWTLAMTSLGSLLLQNHLFVEAERLLSKVLQLEPQNAPALAALVDLRMGGTTTLAELTDLLEKLTVITSKANPTASVWVARASLETRLGKRDAAKLSVAAALKIEPRNRNALFQLANLALADGDIVKAKEAAKILETVSPNTASFKILSSDILVAEGRSNDALKADLEKQLETDAKNPLILGRLCVAYRISDPTKALDFCRRASESEPTNVNPAVGYGAALVQAKQFGPAVTILRKIIEIAPDNSTAHANLATALFELKRYGEAKAEYEWLTMKQPTLAAAYFFLAITHDHLNEYADAVANYQQYLRIADPVANKLDIDKVNLRLPALLKKIKK